MPLYNEEDNVFPLVEQMHEALAKIPWPWELILVDDGSSDLTEERIRKVATQYPDHVSAVILQRNFGQTAAMQAGIDAANGTIIATLDGDLQNDPHDIPRMVQRLLDEDLDLLVGWRRRRSDRFWLRKVPSWIANRLIARVTGIVIHDYGCSLKIFRGSIIKQVGLYGEMHRFIPTWMATQTAPRRIKEEPVNHFPRIHGQSKYGLSRTLKVIVDLLSVYFFMRFFAKPGHFFGRIGLLFGLLGSCGLAYLAYLKIFLGESIGERPLLVISALFALTGVQFLCTGIVTEILTRTYFESTHTKTYRVREILGHNTAADAASTPGSHTQGLQT